MELGSLQSSDTLRCSYLFTSTFVFYESHGCAEWWDPKDISLNQTSNLEQTEEATHKEAAKKILYRKLLTVDCPKVFNRGKY